MAGSGSPADIELDIGGMTCASCATRVERKLNKLPGVQASVNFATEKARVLAPADIDVQQLLATVAGAGYSATVPLPPDDPTADGVEADPDTSLRHRLTVSTVLAIPPGSMDQPATRWCHDGHPRERGHPCRSGLVALCPVLRNCWRSRHADELSPGDGRRLGSRRNLPRSRQCGHRVSADRALYRSPCEAGIRCGAACSARTRRQGCAEARR